MQNNNSKEGESTTTEPKELNLGAEAKAEKQKLSKKEIKQEKKAKKETKSNVNALTSSIISEMDSPTLEKTKEVSEIQRWFLSSRCKVPIALLS